MEAYFEAKRRLFAQAEPRGRERRRRVGPPARRGAAGRDHASTRATRPRSTRRAAACAAGSTSRTRSAPRRRRGCSASTTTRSARASRRVRGVPGRLRGRRRGAAVHRDRRLLAQARRRSSDVLRAARELARGRVICVFGCGGDRDREKRPLMGRIASELADVAIVTSDNPRSEDPRRDHRRGRSPARPALEVEPDRRAAIAARARGGARRATSSLIAGKGHEQGQEIAGVKHPFDDREVARELLRAVAARVIPLSLDEVAALGPGDLTRAAGRTSHRRPDRLAAHRRGRPLRRGRRRRGLRAGTRSRAARRRRSCPTTRMPRSPRSPAPCATGAPRASSGSPARSARRRRRTSSPRSAPPHARTVAAEASYNNELGVPLTLCRVEPDTEICVLELAMRGFGQIAELCAFARPDIGVITIIAPVHLELVGDARGRRPGEERSWSRRCRPAAPPSSRRGFAVARDDLDVVRVGRGRDASSRFEPPDSPHVARRRSRSSFTARHLALNALAALRRGARARRSPSPSALEVDVRRVARRGAAAAGRRRPHQRRLEREPRLDARRARAPRGSSRPGAARSPCSARWPSSATPTRRTARSARAIEELGVDVLIAVGERARVYGGTPASRMRPRRPRRCVASCRPGDCVLVKASRALGLERDRGIPRGRHRMTRVLVAGIVAGVISIVAGPRFIEFLRRKELGQQIREEGPAGHVTKQGTPTPGGLLILLAASLAFFSLSKYELTGTDGALRDARLRRDRLPRRLHQVHAQALARALRAVEAAAARRGRGRDRLPRAPRRPQPPHVRAHPRHGLPAGARAVLVRPHLPRHRRRRERRQPHRRDRRPRRGHRDHLALHVHGDGGAHVHPLVDDVRTAQPGEARPGDRRRGADRRRRSASSGTTPSPRRSSWATRARWRSAARSAGSRS